MVTLAGPAKKRSSKPGRSLHKMGQVPRHGPYATADWVGNRWRVRLTAAGQKLVMDTLAKYPPRYVNILAAKAPALVKAVNIVRQRRWESEAEFDAVVFEAVCHAASYYEPSGGSFDSFAAFHVLAKLPAALAEWNRWLDRGEMPADDAPGAVAVGAAPESGLPPGLGDLSPDRLRVLDKAFGLTTGVAVPPMTGVGRAQLADALAAARVAVESRL